jgi:hypothetical protein
MLSICNTRSIEMVTEITTNGTENFPVLMPMAYLAIVDALFQI